MIQAIWEIVSGHRWLWVALALALNAASCFLTAKNLERMRTMSLHRKVSLIFIMGCVNGLSAWTTMMVLLASYLPNMMQSSSADIAVLQVIVAVAFGVLGGMSQSPRRIVHQVGLFFVPLLPAAISFELLKSSMAPVALATMPPLPALLVLSLVGFGMALSAPKDPLNNVAPPVAFAIMVPVLGFIGHLAILTSLGLTPDRVGLMSELQSGEDFAHLSMLWPIVLANVMILAVGGANFSMDVAHAREALARFKRLAMYDNLTDLPNRASFNADVDTLSSRAHDGSTFAIALVDLDRFKAVNDRYGHQAGDTLLHEVSRHIGAALKPCEVFYRLGGDEFVGVKTGLHNREEARAFGERLCTLVTEYVNGAPKRFTVGASVGVSVFPEDGISRTELLRRADVALYSVKAQGRGFAAVFRAEMDDPQRHAG